MLLKRSSTDKSGGFIDERGHSLKLLGEADKILAHQTFYRMDRYDADTEEAFEKPRRLYDH
jgi:hypothetical protein